MRCDDCNATIETDEMREHLGRKLCEDCYMMTLSPMKIVCVVPSLMWSYRTALFRKNTP